MSILRLPRQRRRLVLPPVPRFSGPQATLAAAAAAWLVAAVLPAAAAVVDFPGPVVLGVEAEALAATSLTGAPGAEQYAAVGTGDGFILLVQFRPSVGVLSVVSRYSIGQGRVTALIPWQGLPAGSTGVVAAVTDPDRLLFVRITLSPVSFSAAGQVDLEEDPGTLDFAGPDAAGDPLVAVSLPGIDRIAIVGQDAGSWRLRQTLDAGDQPWGLAAADLDGDQVQEVYTADRGVLSESIGIFTMGGDGLYVRSGQYALGAVPQALASLDIDGDGRDELAAACANVSAVHLLRLAADAVVSAGVVPLTLPAQSLCLAGQPGESIGIYAANRERGMVEFVAGTLQAWQAQGSYYAGCRPLACAPADFNLDGLPDLLCPGGDGRAIAVLFGAVAGGLWGFPALALSGEPLSAAIADFDGDGVNDVIVADVGVLGLDRYDGSADGSLPITPVVHALTFFPGPLACLQRDADAARELAIADPNGRRIVLADLPAQGVLQIEGSFAVTDAPATLQAADVDGDGNDDLIALHNGGWSGRIYFGDAAGNFAFSTLLTFFYGARAIAALDLDGDRRQDLAMTDGQDRVWYRRNLTGRTFGADSWVTAAEGARDLAAGDLDGDLDPDLAVYNDVDQSVTLLENDGAGQLIRRIGSHALDGPAEGIDMADVDQDGRRDVLLNLRQAGLVGVVLVGAEWEYSATVTFPGGTDVGLLGAADLNLDLVPDLLALDQTLHLGLAMLNVQRQLVAVDPQALAVACRDGRYVIAVTPDRVGDWLLEYGVPEVDGPQGLVALAGPGFAAAGTLQYDRGTWICTVAPGELQGLGGGGRPQDGILRLTVGLDVRRESLQVALGESACERSEAAGAAGLVWSAQPWPNPFNPRLQARFFLPKAGQVTAGVFDLGGRRVAALLDEWLPAGDHELAWNGVAGSGPAAAGVYLLRISTLQAELTGKVILMK